MASQDRVLNVIDPAFARYIRLRDELERFLKDEYGKSVGEGYDYNIEHLNDRWSFYAPEELSKKKLKALMKKVTAEQQKAANAAEQSSSAAATAN